MFLRRLATTTELDADLVLGLLDRNEWLSWPPVEQRAVMGTGAEPFGSVQDSARVPGGGAPGASVIGATRGARGREANRGIGASGQSFGGTQAVSGILHQSGADRGGQGRAEGGEGGDDRGHYQAEVQLPARTVMVAHEIQYESRERRLSCSPVTLAVTTRSGGTGSAGTGQRTGLGGVTSGAGRGCFDGAGAYFLPPVRSMPGVASAMLASAATTALLPRLRVRSHFSRRVATTDSA